MKKARIVCKFLGDEGVSIFHEQAMKDGAKLAIFTDQANNLVLEETIPAVGDLPGRGIRQRVFHCQSWQQYEVTVEEEKVPALLVDTDSD